MSSEKRTAPPGVHIILGGSAGGIFTRVFGRARLIDEFDILCCGPTRACPDFAAWRAMREDYWKSLVPSRYRESLIGELPLHDYGDRLRSAERINIWAASSLSEQLFIAFIVHRVDALGIDPAQLRLVSFEDQLSMGQLNEEKMAAHPEPTPFAVEDYRAAWDALTAADPTSIETFSARQPGANTSLKWAMQLLLHRFPGTNGLTHWDHMLLEAVRDRGPRALRVIGHAMTIQWEDGDLVGDFYLFGRLLRLADENLPRPLLQLSGERTTLHDTEVALTDFGREVLEGRATSYPVNPIEDWAAGVKLSSKSGPLWFNQDGKIRAAITS